MVKLNGRDLLKMTFPNVKIPKRGSKKVVNEMNLGPEKLLLYIKSKI